ncbi:MAG: ribosome-associated translation inhibitor RaiA [Patescibacteria group bacterium]
MRIIIQGTPKEHSKELDPVIRSKVRGLTRYAPVVKEAVVDVHHDRHHRKGSVAYVEISLHLFCHGNLPIRATETANDIHAALDLALEKVKRQLVAHKEKDTAVQKKVIRKASGKEGA